MLFFRLPQSGKASLADLAAQRDKRPLWGQEFNIAMRKENKSPLKKQDSLQAANGGCSLSQINSMSSPW